MGGERGPVRLRQSIEAVKQLILSRGLMPGDPLPTEAELCELLDVSRANLREAMRTLAALDILDVRHGTGTFVGEMSMRPLVEGLTFRGVAGPGDDFDKLRQIVQVRSALDEAMAPHLIERLEGNRIPDLEELCDSMARHTAAGEGFAGEDRDFHLGLASILGNEIWRQLVVAFWDIHRIVGPRLGVPTPEDLQDTIDAHRAMLDAAVNGDLKAYRDAVRAHYQPLLKVLDSTT